MILDNSTIERIDEDQIEHLEAIVKLLNSTASVLQEKGIPQWDGFDIGGLRADLHKGARLYLVHHNSKPIATFSWRKSDYDWREKQIQEEESGDAAYFYRYSLRADLIGQQMGAKLMPLIESHLAGHERISVLRLDCWAGNSKLKMYYHSCGFTEIGTQPEHDYFVTLFEKKIDLN